MAKTKSNIDVKGENLFSNLSIILRGAAVRLDQQHKFLKKTCSQLSQDLQKMQGEYKVVKMTKKEIKK
jgi:hypothetical protein